MSISHKNKLENIAGQLIKSKGLNDDFYNENDNLDAVKYEKTAHDSQYLSLMKDMASTNKKRTKKMSSEQDLEDMPQYKGKKVSMKDFKNKNFQTKNFMEQEESDVDEDEDDDDELLEREYVDSSDENIEQNGENSSEILDDDDDQEELEAFDENQFEDESEENGINNGYEDSSDSQEEEKLQYKQATLGQKGQKKVNNDKITQMVKQIEEEDTKIQPKQKQEQQNELEKAKHVRNQLLFWKQQSLDRMSIQKPLELVKRFPLNMDYYKDLQGQQKYSEMLIVQNLNLMLRNRDLFYKKLIQNIDEDIEEEEKEDDEDQDSEIDEQQKNENKLNQKNLIQKDQFDYLEDYLFQTENDLNSEQKNQEHHQINIDKLQENFEKSQEKTKKFIEDNIFKWSQKTNLVATNLKKQGFSQLLSTPIGQTQKAMKQPQRLIIKSQLKRDKFRIFGQSDKDLYEETNENIYDDADYYHELLKEQLEDDGGDLQDEDGLQLNNTKIYLLERKLKQQERLANKIQSKEKQVDRRASKARKLRFHTHQKLVNFTNPQENIYLLEGRNEIIKSLFGVEANNLKQKVLQQKQQKSNNQNPEEKLRKKRKGNDQQEIQNHDDEEGLDEIDII